ncbi:hypothetical protein ACIQB5_46430 [Streptomyces sp. NPDC088560]|uniref:hypothetical protein n=1 Tax=Streptomyces sp. NPDC088560 TaxID=3365868 RepID=UPI00380F81D4
MRALPLQTAELLDGLVATRTLASWCHNCDAGEVTWHLIDQRPSVRPWRGAAAGAVADVTLVLAGR